MKTLFISRNLETGSPLLKLEDNYKIIDESLIDFEGLELSTDIKSSWIFFYSKNGVKYLHQATPHFNINNYKVACLGKGTEKAYKNLYHRSPEFSGSGDPKGVHEKFIKVLVPGDSVTFLSALNSRNSIQLLLQDSYPCQSIPVYTNTIKQNASFSKPHIGIFTSPLNVQAYMTNYNLEELELVLSIGKTTALSLHHAGANEVVIAPEPSDRGLYIALLISTMQ